MVRSQLTHSFATSVFLPSHFFGKKRGGDRKMFHFLRYSTLFLRSNSIQAFRIQSLPNPCRKCHCQTNPPFSLIEYLETSLGFSPEMAFTLSQKLKDRKPKNPDSVLAFFKSHGLSETQIKSVINRAPSLLGYVPESGLRPKISFFQEKGISDSDLADLMVSNPCLFIHSLERYIKPLLDLLRGAVGTDKVAVKLLIRSKYGFGLDTLSTNLNILRNCGVQNHHISKLFMEHPRGVGSKSDRFNEAVDMVKEMGFKPQSSLFLQAVLRITGLSRQKWDAKFKLYISLGMSDKEVLALFRRQPPCMNLSEEKIRKGFHYLTKELGWSPPHISIHPVLLLLSLEKRIIPRHRFLQFLASKGFITKDKISATSFMVSEEKFLKNFVVRYESKAPDALKIYKHLIGSKLLNVRDGTDRYVH